MRSRPFPSWRIGRRVALTLLGVAMLLPLLVVAQGFRGRGRVVIEPNVPYDGRFTFARLRYPVYRRSGWEFDYPAMERHLMTMMEEVTTLRPHRTGSNIHTLDDPDLLRYPIAYLSEPGGWYPNDVEAAGLRTYLQKGGFLIVDDFMMGDWQVFVRAMQRVLPEGRLVRLDASHPVYDSFFRVDSLVMHHPQAEYLDAEFWGIHEDNDPDKRLMVVVNYNTDIGDFMEWSDQEFWPVNTTNDAYKLAINYLVYGLTH